MAALAALAPLALAADGWQTDVQVDPASGVETRLAFVEDTEGYRLGVRPGGAGGGAICTFQLPDDGGTLSRNHGLEVRVDTDDPLSIMRWESMEKPFEDADDFMEARRRISGVVPLVGGSASRVGFRCWLPLKDQASPASGLLRQLLDGDSVTFDFALTDAGEQQVRFALDGAAEAIIQTLAISAQPTTKDRAQVELLAFRVNYRSTTCYLLAGKKGRKRCLAAVNRCAQRTHESVLSMLECVEGK